MSRTGRACHRKAWLFLTRTCRSWPTLAKPTLASVGVLVVWPTLGKTDFGQTDFGQNRLVAKDRLWPKPTLAKPSLAKSSLTCCVWCVVCGVVCCGCVCGVSVCGVVWVLVSRFHGVGFHVWCWFQGFGLVMFGAPGPPFTGPPFDGPSQDRPSQDRPSPGPPKNFGFFSLSRHKIRSFLPSLRVFSWNFGGVFEGRGPSNVHVWALWLLCETPEALGPPGLRTRTRELQTCTLERPGLQNTTKIPREDTQRGKKRIFKRERGKKERNFGPPTLRAPTLRPPPFGPPPFLGLGPLACTPP